MKWLSSTKKLPIKLISSQLMLISESTIEDPNFLRVKRLSNQKNRRIQDDNP
ncbi:hypothetical protein HMPREF9103_00925 [Lentilactobacillus parafarraginis F0439]|uniref:Uncharacterized protein n=1 Tax=Lentilactobacillus parafarraginis F0439 TaxID=797515 RepID=G9ZMH6_9LACO|nr:hypothetical protein HMPREF9103_00925 [Lentilactobacillus parafarraginis F0439]